MVLAGDMNGWNLNAAAAFQRIASWQDTIGTTGDLLPGASFLLITYENFFARIQSLGFLALSHLLPGLPSLGEETPESLWHTGLDTDPWHWKDRVAEEKRLAYGCILGGHKGFVTQRMYPIFYAAFQPTLSMPEHWANRGTHSHLCRRKS